MQYPWWHLIMGPLSHCNPPLLTTELKEISTDAVSSYQRWLWTYYSSLHSTLMILRYKGHCPADVIYIDFLNLFLASFFLFFWGGRGDTKPVIPFFSASLWTNLYCLASPFLDLRCHFPWTDKLSSWLSPYVNMIVSAFHSSRDGSSFDGYR